MPPKIPGFGAEPHGCRPDSRLHGTLRIWQRRPFIMRYGRCALVGAEGRQVGSVVGSWQRRALLRWYTATMDSHSLRAYKNYLWIVSDPALLGGKPAIRGTRLSASLILSCLAEGMTVEEIEESYGHFPHEAIPEVLKAASELLDAPHVAA